MQQNSPITVVPPRVVSMTWHRWSPENDIAFRRQRACGNGEERLCWELSLLGQSVTLIEGNSLPYDIDGSIGRVQVKAPDSAGRIVTGKHGHALMSWLLDECQWIYRLAQRVLPGAVDPPLDNHLAEVRERLSTRTMNISFWEKMMDLVTVMNMMFEGDSPHEWVTDPHLFQADCCSVFLSEAINADVLALVCEDGYSLVAKRDLDLLFHFRGEVWNGKPKFTCDDATAVNRKKKLMKPHTTKLDKIADIDRIRGQQDNSKGR